MFDSVFCSRSFTNNPLKSIVAPEFSCVAISCSIGIETCLLFRVLFVFVFVYIFCLRFVCFQTNPAFECFHLMKVNNLNPFRFCLFPRRRWCFAFSFAKQWVPRIYLKVKFTVTYKILKVYNFRLLFYYRM